MKKQICVLVAVMVLAIKALAAPGDTTWVQAHYGVNLTNYNDYDTAITFPTGTTSYRKVVMIVTLGKYQCPTGSQWCGDWDYTVQNFLMTPGGDTLELSRLITPYANVSYTRFPWTWKQHYYYDVTDFYPVLKNNATIRLHYSGYSGGFTADIKFAFIEGTPSRNVLSVQRAWHGDFTFGNASDPINNHLQTLNKTAPTGTAATELKFTATGHGSDSSEQCSEFCSKYYNVVLNSNILDVTQLWRTCGTNDLYPQSGTWVFDRGNWCPGAAVSTHSHTLTGVTAGNNYNVGVTFQPYTDNHTGSHGLYTIQSHLVYYGGFNFPTDASIEDVIAPTKNEVYYRANPSSYKPVIKIRNNGSNSISSVAIEYGVDDTLATYTWNGTLGSLKDSVITLPQQASMANIAGTTAVHKFTARITQVNGAIDGDTSNNKFTTFFTPAALWNQKIVVTMKTNGSAVGSVSEDSWQIFDLNDNIVAQRTNAAVSTLYNDTVSLPTGSYKLVFSDAGCDGISFWMFQYYTPNPGNGSFSVKKYSTGFSPNYVMPGYLSGDFGCGFTQYFSVIASGTSVAEVSAPQLTMSVFPNPAQHQVEVKIDGVNDTKGTIRVYDAIGNIVLEKTTTNTTEVMNIDALSNGIYNVIYQSNQYPDAKLHDKMVIAR